MASSSAITVKDYLAELPVERRKAVEAVRKVIRKNLPQGYVESMQYGMIGYSVPLKYFSDTYNGAPLAYVSLASQKNHMAVYTDGHLWRRETTPLVRKRIQENGQAYGRRVLAVVLAGANAYLGLFAGLTVSASIPAAVISMAVLRLFRRSNILENNLVQTAASAGESLAAGVIFTISAMLMLGAWTEFHYWDITLIAALGGVVGVMFTIPLRRAFIVERPLRFPEGVATAEVLKVGAARAVPARG